MEMNDNIYINSRIVAEEKSTSSIGEDSKTNRTNNIMDPERPVISTAGRRCYKLTGVCLGLMCVLLLPAIAALPAITEKDQLQQLQASYEKLKTERDELEARYKNVTTEKDQLQTSYNSLMIEKNQLQTSYNNLMTEKDQLQSSYNDLIVKRDQLQTSYNNLETERDQLQISCNNIEKERDQLQSKINETVEENEELSKHFLIAKFLLIKARSELEDLQKTTTRTGCIGVGDRVKVKASVKSPTHGWGDVSHKSIGVVTAVDGGKVIVNFPEDNSWNGVLSEMEQASSADVGYFRVGDRVRVKASVSTPKYEWGEASHSSVGVVKGIVGERMLVDFPDHKSWLAATFEMELAPHDGNIRVGDRVRVKSSVSVPKHKWGNASHKSVGVVTEIDDDEDILVDFPEHKSWKGIISEMELVSPVDSEFCKFKLGDKVRVKGSVESPKYNRGSVSHKSVGTVKALKIVVDFPENSGWTADPSELERAS